MKKVTMDFIAEIADVSKSTVSRALSNDSRVNEDTRERITRIARELNYQPNKVAQALAKNFTNVIGVVIPWFPRTVADPFFLEFLQGIGDLAHDKGYSLILPNIDQDGIEKLSNNKVDGVILTEPFFDDPRIDYLKKKKIPFVFLGNPMAGDDICWVDSDNEKGAYQAVNYLIESGHRKIATITGSVELVAGKYRLEGYKKALLENGIEINSDLIVKAKFTQESAYQAAKELLKYQNDFTAIFAANDLMAMGAMKALKEEGLKIPFDVAIMGYDGIQFGEFVDPPLSTIKLPSIKMGRVAMRLLLQLINNENMKEKQVMLPPKLLLRKSA